MDLEHLWRMLRLKNPSPVALSITYGVGGCLWPISVSTMHIADPHWKFLKRVTNYASITLASTLSMFVHLEFTGPLSGG